MEQKVTATERKDSIFNENVSFEKALSLTGIGKYNYTIFVIAIFSLLAAAAEIFGVGILVASAQCDLELDVHRKGLVASVPMLGVVASAHLWGYIADTRGRKYALTITMLGTTIASVISSFANHWMFLAFMKFLSAGFASGTNAVIYALLGEAIPEYNRPRFLLYSATCVMLSQFVNSLIAYPVLNMTFSFYIPYLGLYRPWRLLAKLFGLQSFLNFLLLHVFALESPKYYFAKGDNDNGLEVLRQMYFKNHGSSLENYPVKKVILDEKIVRPSDQNIFRSMWNQTVPLFTAENRKNMFLVSFISVLIYSFGPAFSVWLPTILSVYSQDINTDRNFCQILQKTPIQSENNSTLLLLDPEIQDTICNDNISEFTLLGLVSFSIYMTFITTISVVLIKYTGKRWMFIGVHIISIGLCLTINLVYNIGGIVMLGALLSPALGIGIVTTFAVELFPTYLRAMAVCLTMMIGRAFSFISINLIGPQLENNCNNFMFIVAGLLIVGTIVACFLPDDKKLTKTAEFKPKEHCDP